MNIDDVIKKIEIPEEPIIVAIFNHHRELMKKYDVIERKNGYYVPNPPYNLEDTKVQQRIKDMFWRVTEELAEAIETIPPEFQLFEWVQFWDTYPDIRHFFEELADALHFLVEASILVRLSLKEIQFNTLSDNYRSLSGFSHKVTMEIIAAIIFKMGIAANTFKNKPWKLTQMPTDIVKFKKQLVDVWEHFINLWKYLGCNQKQVYIFYAKKNLVNQWRQKTNY